MNELVNAWVYNTNKWIERNTEEKKHEPDLKLLVSFMPLSRQVDGDSPFCPVICFSRGEIQLLGSCLSTSLRCLPCIILWPCLRAGLDIRFGYRCGYLALSFWISFLTWYPGPYPIFSAQPILAWAPALTTTTTLNLPWPSGDYESQCQVQLQRLFDLSQSSLLLLSLLPLVIVFHQLQRLRALVPILWCLPLRSRGSLSEEERQGTRLRGLLVGARGTFLHRHLAWLALWSCVRGGLSELGWQESGLVLWWPGELQAQIEQNSWLLGQGCTSSFVHQDWKVPRWSTPQRTTSELWEGSTTALRCPIPSPPRRRHVSIVRQLASLSPLVSSNDYDFGGDSDFCRRQEVLHHGVVGTRVRGWSCRVLCHGCAEEAWRASSLPSSRLPSRGGPGRRQCIWVSRNSWSIKGDISSGSAVRRWEGGPYRSPHRCRVGGLGCVSFAFVSRGGASRGHCYELLGGRRQCIPLSQCSSGDNLPVAGVRRGQACAGRGMVYPRTNRGERGRVSGPASKAKGKGKSKSTWGFYYRKAKKGNHSVTGSSSSGCRGYAADYHRADEGDVGEAEDHGREDEPAEQCVSSFVAASGRKAGSACEGEKFGGGAGISTKDEKPCFAADPSS